MLGSWATSSSVKAGYGGGNPSHVHRSGLYSISSHLRPHDSVCPTPTTQHDFHLEISWALPLLTSGEKPP